MAITGTPFGLMAFLGGAKLSGSSSPCVVLFDFIEEMHEKGDRWSGLFGCRDWRLRPAHDPPWAQNDSLLCFSSRTGKVARSEKPLCYAQISADSPSLPSHLASWSRSV